MSCSTKPVSLAVSLLGLAFSGCGNWCNDCNEPRISYRYINQSGYGLVMEPPVQLKTVTLNIPEGDSAQVNQSWLERSEFEGFKYVLRFRSQPESCLVFQGKVQNHALDIRWGGYEIDSTESSAAITVYRMAIGSDHLGASSPCQAGP